MIVGVLGALVSTSIKTLVRLAVPFAKKLLPVTLTNPASVTIPKLAVNCPAPEMLEPTLELKGPPSSRAVPAGTLIVLLFSPPPSKESVRALRSPILERHGYKAGRLFGLGETDDKHPQILICRCGATLHRNRGRKPGGGLSFVGDGV